MAITTLCTELLEMCFQHLSPADLFSCIVVCQHFTWVIQNSPNLIYKLEKHKGCVTETFLLKTEGVVQQLSCLRTFLKQRSEWLHSPILVHLVEETPALGFWKCISGCFVSLNDCFTMQIILPTAPSSPRLIERQHTIEGFSIDSEQDLLILKEHWEENNEITLGILSLKDGSPHPFAIQEYLKFDNEELELVFHSQPVIKDNMVAIQLQYTDVEDGEFVLVLDWRSATQLVDLPANVPDCFAFLSADRMVVGWQQASGFELRIHKLSSGAMATKLPFPPPWTANPRSFSTGVDGNGGGLSSQFATAFNDRIAALSLAINNGGDSPLYAFIIFSRQSLLDAIEFHNSSPEILWDGWTKCVFFQPADVDLLPSPSGRMLVLKVGNKFLIHRFPVGYFKRSDNSFQKELPELVGYLPTIEAAEETVVLNEDLIGLTSRCSGILYSLLNSSAIRS
ncbi:hypothetical protein BDN72DRAFT_842887 [Pluteus cervinus]|uniref:Uncharacterized protein n=1 Tax=Pluteus cervinus TaxID=181527 RepID=A0ACD3API4_9AGAR|nr:hypothetical protein BDN72DRAFT_842887 [Pluteus cervinus]